MTDKVDIPKHILRDVGLGQCTLFLGAGASKASKAPSGNDFGTLITKRFLGDSDWNLSLETAASLVSASQRNRTEVERFVYNRLSRLRPSPSHKKIPWFYWRALITTNYDQLIEEAYDEETRAAQRLKPILREIDLSQIEQAGSDSVILLKPHGCISHLDLMSLSLEDIHEAKKTRRLLFSYIEMLHLASPVIYIGYSLKDIHILDMIYELNERLGDYRKPILFVTQQEAGRAEIERTWFDRILRGEYLACGFERFMDALCQEVPLAISPSMIVKQMTPCRVLTFKSNAVASYKIKQEDGVWVCWLTYTIDQEDGFAGIFFEKKGDPINISSYTCITFELNIQDSSRGDWRLEALKLEGYYRSHKHLLNVKDYKGREWKPVKINFAEYDMPDVNNTPIHRIVFADNGGRAILKQEYQVGIRNIKFE